MTCSPSATDPPPEARVNTTRSACPRRWSKASLICRAIGEAILPVQRSMRVSGREVEAPALSWPTSPSANAEEASPVARPATASASKNACSRRAVLPRARPSVSLGLDGQHLTSPSVNRVVRSACLHSFLPELGGAARHPRHPAATCCSGAETSNLPSFPRARGGSAGNQRQMGGGDRGRIPAPGMTAREGRARRLLKQRGSPRTPPPLGGSCGPCCGCAAGPCRAHRSCPSMLKVRVIPTLL